MDVQSLAFRTELALMQLGGTLVEDRGSHLVVRTPHNPSFFWGNFLLLPAPPAADRVEHWLATFRSTFPDAEHVALGLDRLPGSPGDLDPLREAGFRVDVAVSMTATSVHPPPRRGSRVDLRSLGGEADWDSQAALSVAGEEDPHLTPEFVERRTRSMRELTEAGHGTWFGAFVDGRLVSSLGIFRAGADLARFQQVKTHPDFRGQGLAGSLVHAASRHALDVIGARTLVMVADPGYPAIRVYRSVGFVEGGRHVEATLLPPVPACQSASARSTRSTFPSSSPE